MTDPAPVNPRNRKFSPLPVGATLGGCEVLSGNNALHRAEQVYRIKHLCCGRTDLMSHKTLVQRHSSGVRFCQDCGHQQGGRVNKHPPELRQKALKLRQEGHSTRKIGKMLGVSQWTVREWCKPGETAKAPAKKLNLPNHW